MSLTPILSIALFSAFQFYLNPIFLRKTHFTRLLWMIHLVEHSFTLFLLDSRHKVLSGETIWPTLMSFYCSNCLSSFTWSFPSEAIARTTPHISTIKGETLMRSGLALCSCPCFINLAECGGLQNWMWSVINCFIKPW